MPGLYSKRAADGGQREFNWRLIGVRREEALSEIQANHHMYGKGGEVDKSLVASWYQRIGQISSVTALSKIFVDIQADLLRYIGRRRVASAPHPQIHIMMRLA